MCPIGEQFLLSSFREFVHDGYCLDHGLSGSCTKEMHAVRKLSVWYKIPIWFQNTVCPKTKDAFPKIQASAYNRYSGWKSEFIFFSVSIVIIPTRLLCQMQVNSSRAEFLSAISKFTKRMNFVIAFLRPSQNVKSGIFTGSSAVNGKEMYKKAWCTCKVVVLPCQATAYLTFCRRRILNFLLFTIHCDPSKTEYSGQMQLLLLIAFQTFFRLIGSSFVSG